MRLIPVVAAAIILAVGLASPPVAADLIHHAAGSGNVAWVKELLASGVNVNVRNEYDEIAHETPLHRARSVEVAQVLLNAGAWLNARNVWGVTPLHSAVAERRVEVAKFLLRAGAKVNTRNEKGGTPLHSAVGANRAEVVEFLLRAGANPKAKDKEGYTPFDYAKKWDMLKGTDAYWLLHDAQFD
jgi:cytohesin